MVLPDVSEGDLGHVSHHDELHERYNNSVEIRSGTTAARPAAGAVDVGTLYWDTDTETLHRSNGATWDDLTSGVSDHGALAGLADDDHPQYLTEAEADALYEALGDIAVHAAAADPHTGYRLESADHTHQTTGLQAGKIDHGAALDGLADDDHTQYHTAARHASVDAADHSSGAAADGTVLTADGAGGAAWEAASAGGAPDYVFANSNTPVDVSDTVDVTVVTRDLAVAATQVIEVEICGLVVNDSGASRLWTYTLDFDGAFDLEFTRTHLAAAGTSRTPVRIVARCHVHSSSLANMVSFIHMNNVGRASGTDVGVGADQWLEESGWGTTGSDLTGTCTVTFKIRSDSGTTTQTFAVTSAVMRVYSQT